MMTSSDRQLERLAALVSERLGLRIEDWNEGQIGDAMRTRMRDRAIPDFDAYHDCLTSEASAPEWRCLSQLLTVGETYFFRHPDQFEAFGAVALPECLQARRQGERIRILSAGCASGEEAYTLAVFVAELLGERADEVEIVGIDVNPAFLHRARTATYSPWSLRGTPEPARNRYFKPQGREFRLADDLRARVRFEERNLVAEDAAFWRPGAFDVIFCRNVLIYFSPEATREVIARFTRSLAPGGYLFLGPAESLRGVSRDFHLRHTHGAFYYQHRDGSSALPVAVAIAPSVGSWVDAIRQASDRIAALTREDAPPPTRHERPTWDLAFAMSLFGQERFTEVMEWLHDLPPAANADPDTLLLQAAVLTNLGRIPEAEAVCDRILAHDEFNAGAHYLLALCCEHAGDPAAAQRHDETAVYLDREFAMPHLHMGLLARRSGDLEASRRALGQALGLLAREDSARILLFGGGFSREALEGLCRSQLPFEDRR